jgi:hypothetical protein
MLPFGLQFEAFKSPKKLPMTLENSSMEDLKKHIYKIANIECPKEKKSKSKSKKTRKVR